MHNITVLLDTSPLQSGSSIRGIGAYTRLLQQSLEQLKDVHVIPLTDKYALRKIKKTHPELTQKNTIIHYPFFDLFFSTLPAFRPFKTVVTVHDVIPLKFPEQYKPGLKGTLRYYKQVFKLRRTQAVITDSKASSNDIITLLKVPESKTHVVYLAASEDIKHQNEYTVSDVLKTYNLPKNYVLYVGDINYNKNIPQLIKMIKFLPEDVDLVCVGKNFSPQDIPEWKWIETQVALSDAAARVHFITSLENTAAQELSALYSGAIAYIQPSLYEGFGLPVLEAMQARCPVIAAKNSSLIEVVGEHGILVEPEAEHLAHAVKEILGWSENHRKTVIRDAYAWSQEFSWIKVATETRQIYRHVLGLT